jgi:hypothetical protein
MTDKTTPMIADSSTAGIRRLITANGWPVLSQNCVLVEMEDRSIRYWNQACRAPDGIPCISHDGYLQEINGDVR